MTESNRQAGETSGGAGAPGLRPQRLPEVGCHELPDEGVSPGGGASALHALRVGGHEAQLRPPGGASGLLQPAALCAPPQRSQDTGDGYVTGNLNTLGMSYTF